jgi:hypothetical protein
MEAFSTALSRAKRQTLNPGCLPGSGGCLREVMIRVRTKTYYPQELPGAEIEIKILVLILIVAANSEQL